MPRPLSSLPSTRSHKKAKLQDLLALFNIKEQHLHNAGNDSACTLVAAMLIGFADIGSEEANYSLLKTGVRDRAVNECKENAPPTKFFDTKDNIPQLTFCTRCDSMDHFAADCKTTVHCDYCAEHPSHIDAAAMHKTESASKKSRMLCLYGRSGAHHRSTRTHARDASSRRIRNGMDWTSLMDT